MSADSFRDPLTFPAPCIYYGNLRNDSNGDSKHGCCCGMCTTFAVATILMLAACVAPWRDHQLSPKDEFLKAFCCPPYDSLKLVRHALVGQIYLKLQNGTSVPKTRTNRL